MLKYFHHFYMPLCSDGGSWGWGEERGNRVTERREGKSKIEGEGRSVKGGSPWGFQK